MEAVGSRLGRASSRYGAPAVFSGPVRKWKKKWVHVSSSATTFHNSDSHVYAHSNGGSRLLLCRWTPITAPSTAADDSDSSSGNVSDEPSRRKFRYTPIAVLEEQKNLVIKKPEYEPIAENDQSANGRENMTHEMHRKPNMNEISKKETQDSNIRQLNLGLGFNGNNGDSSQNSDDHFKRISSGWFMN